MTHIAIIGAGQLGSRHLQGLARINRAIQISVFDPDPSSLETAKSRYREIPTNGLIQSISFSESLITLNNDVDVAIVATHADVRRKVVEELLEQVRVRFLVLEKVAFQSVEDFQAVINLLEENGTRAWVNCTRRMFPFYKALKLELQPGENVYMYVDGGNWGLASNSIHMLDLFAFLTGKTQLSLDTSGLDNKVYKSKRNGFIELGGTVSATTSREDCLTLIDEKESNRKDLLEISSANHRYTIFELEGKVVARHKDSKWAEWDQPFVMPYQSELTHLVIHRILDSGECDLTPLYESFALHIPMLEAFTNHLQLMEKSTITHCPIT